MWVSAGTGEEDAKMVIWRVLGLDSAEQTLIPDGILPLCCDRDRDSILAVMSVVGAGRSRSSRGGASGSAAGAGGGGATAGGSRTSGPGGSGSSRAPGPSRGPGDDSASDPKGKRKVLAAANSTVREGLNAQVQALAEERAVLEAEWAQLAVDRVRVDEGRRAVDDMVRVGRKMRQAQLAEIQAREEALDSVMRETKEEWQVVLIVSSVLDEALGDIRLQYEAHAEDLAKRIRDARGILDAAAAHERRASEADALLRARTAALEAERRALD
ncbi:uncharacterized protein LOC127757314 [Oryza glaberrima]|uniref:uncharacterized protein LOC127757314 n=1 Tax=Oryza glaberrima TaxID=4538 RepID=UPI00224C1D27|nr:uncharacterized protein LOC127757314 [Oryza glaberrima]